MAALAYKHFVLLMLLVMISAHDAAAAALFAALCGVISDNACRPHNTVNSCETDVKVCSVYRHRLSRQAMKHT